MTVWKAKVAAATWLAAGLLAVGTLTGCGPRTIRTMIAPETYTVSSTITFQNPDGSSETQTQRYRCKILDTRDTFNGGLITEPVGERHWKRLPDGSILIVGGMRPCPWTEKPVRGKSVRAEPHDERSPANTAESSADTYVFDDAEAPTRVDVYDTQAITETLGAAFDTPVLFTGRRKAAPSLTSAFPGVRSLASGHRSVSAVRSDLAEDAFSGVIARVFEVPQGVTCEGVAQSGIILVEAIGGSCADIRDCAQPRPQSVCPLYLGTVRVRLNEDYTRADLSGRETPDRLFWMQYLRNDIIRARYPATEAAEGWRPKLCYDGHCTADSDAHFYDPETHRLIWVSVRERAFLPEEFTSRVKSRPAR